MHITLIACGDNPEVLWNCFRMGNLMLEQMDEVTIFLDGPSVNFASLSSEKYPLQEQAKLFTLSEGVLQAWGKLLDLHGVEDGYHKRAKQIDLYQLITKSDKVITF